MRLSARLFAPLLAAVAFAVPATVPAAHAAHIPAPSAVVVDATPTPALVPTVVMKAGTQLGIVNRSGSESRYSFGTYSSPTIASPGVGFIQHEVSDLAAVQTPQTWTLTRGSVPIAYVVVV